MTDLRTAAQQMLEALEGGADSWQLVGPAIDALKEALVEDAMQKFTDVSQEIEAALAEPVKQCMAHGECFGGECIYQRPAEPGQDHFPDATKMVQEPVAWSHINGTSDTKWHPPQRKPLTEVDLRALYDRHAAYQEEGPEASGWWEFARAIERAYGIKE